MQAWVDLTKFILFVSFAILVLIVVKPPPVSAQRRATFEELYRSSVGEDGQMKSKSYKRTVPKVEKSTTQAEPKGLPKPLKNSGGYVTTIDPVTGVHRTEFKYTISVEEVMRRRKQLEAAAPGPRSSYEQRYYYWIDKYQKYPECFT